MILVVATAAAFGLFTLVSDPAASTHTDHHLVTHTVVVAPGQTLWDIAVAAAPGDDPRAMVARIVDLNGLASAGDVRAGMPLIVPGA